ncbi:hypothetical protein LWI29_036816 [Acer saccharum]|uniref:Pentatricopeptide repeat-containing protein n=1 Tax=Acer saccharum TaxID=4024 RepID=A0AA39T9A8_ACESA|nr:hypothetical protein LWI29_036816 [Acer saccharum]
MSLRFPTSHVPCTFQRAARTANQLLSRAITTANLRNAGDPEDDFVSFNNETFNFNDNPSNPVDSSLISQLQQQNGSLQHTPLFLNSIISSCAKSASLDVGVRVHSLVVKLGFTSNLYICTALVDMYGKCKEIVISRKLFDEMHHRNVVTWNSIIFGYLHAKSPKTAVELFVEMLKAGVEPTPFSVSSVFVCCSQLEDVGVGAQVHGLTLKMGFGYNVVVGTGLIDMYSKCCFVEKASRVFDQMEEKNVITWTSLVTGYVQNLLPDEAMVLVREMLRLGLKANYVTYNSLLSSFSSLKYLNCCKQVHCCVIREGFEANVYIAVTLVTVYSKCDCSLEDFEKVCSSITRWDQISWNAVIAGFCNLGCGDQALKCFSEMRQTRIDIDYFTLTSVVGGIGVILGLKEGEEMHALILKTGYGSNVFVQNGLVSMYAKCGAINDSKMVFSSMDERDVISWNSLISGCAHHGYGREAVELFEQMRKTKVKPNGTTFLSVICACSHAGLIDKGLEYFNLLQNDDSLESPRVEHYATVVDLFGRAGYLDQAESFVNSMPIAPGPSVYKALLSACQIHGNREIAVRSAEKLLELWPSDPAIYVLLSNVLTMTGYRGDAVGIRTLMCDRGMWKKPGYSWV